MKKIKIGLLARIIIAIILGIAIGTFFPAPLVRIFVTFNGIFSEFLNFSIPLIIVGLVTVAIADIGKGAGKMLLVTALIAYFATLFSGFLSYFTGVTVFPSLIEPGVPLEEVSEAKGILPYFSVSIPPLMNVMTALVLAFTLGLGLASLNSDALKNVARDFQAIIVRMISAEIQTIPSGQENLSVAKSGNALPLPPWPPKNPPPIPPMNGPPPRGPL